MSAIPTGTGTVAPIVATTAATPSSLATKLSAYLALTKPDVSFLVLMTTAAGFYMGARGPIGTAADWLRQTAGHWPAGTTPAVASDAAEG